MILKRRIPSQTSIRAGRSADEMQVDLPHLKLKQRQFHLLDAPRGVSEPLHVVGVFEPKRHEASL